MGSRKLSLTLTYTRSCNGTPSLTLTTGCETKTRTVLRSTTPSITSPTRRPWIIPIILVRNTEDAQFIGRTITSGGIIPTAPTTPYTGSYDTEPIRLR